MQTHPALPRHDGVSARNFLARIKTYDVANSLRGGYLFLSAIVVIKNKEDNVEIDEREKEREVEGGEGRRGEEGERGYGECRTCAIYFESRVPSGRLTDRFSQVNFSHWTRRRIRSSAEGGWFSSTSIGWSITGRLSRTTDDARGPRFHGEEDRDICNRPSRALSRYVVRTLHANPMAAGVADGARLVDKRARRLAAFSEING